MKHHLAQFNIARLAAPLDDPRTAEFVAGLDSINKLAEESPGFVWRLKDESGNATSLNPYKDPMIIINMSVWSGVEALREFTYRTRHVDYFRRRGEWFEPIRQPNLVLWWIEAGSEPTIAQGRLRLSRLRSEGPTPQAFDFKTTFPAG